MSVCFFLAFFLEIYHAFDQAWINSELEGIRDTAVHLRSRLWLQNYSYVFVIALGWWISTRSKNQTLNTLMIILNFIAVLAFLMFSLSTMNELRNLYIRQSNAELFYRGSWLVGLRYLSYLCLPGLLYVLHRMLKKTDQKQGLQYFPLLVHFSILCFLSNELTTIMQLWYGLDTTSLAHRVGYSILWAVYALIVIFIGFRQKSRILRIAAIVLFGLTLLKVFLIDLVDISTISKTILFIALGILLLIISYLYQRYKDVLLAED